MKQPKTLINFYVPENLKTTFDSICYNYGYSRTAALLALMSSFIDENAPKIAKAEKQMESINQQLSNTRKMISFNEFLSQSDDDLSNTDVPLGFHSTGGFDNDPNNF